MRAVSWAGPSPPPPTPCAARRQPPQNRDAGVPSVCAVAVVGVRCASGESSPCALPVARAVRVLAAASNNTATAAEQWRARRARGGAASSRARPWGPPPKGHLARSADAARERDHTRRNPPDWECIRRRATVDASSAPRAPTGWRSPASQASSIGLFRCVSRVPSARTGLAYLQQQAFISVTLNTQVKRLRTCSGRLKSVSLQWSPTKPSFGG